jgi:serine O-acetyltransferase
MGVLLLLLITAFKPSYLTIQPIIMTKDLIIKTLKGHSSINYGIKTKIEDFTEKLFYTLFDANAPLSESIDELRVLFKEISIIACKTERNL